MDKQLNTSHEATGCGCLESTNMSRRTDANPLSPAERRREIAAILARGVLRLRHIARTGKNMHAQKSPADGEKGLELSGETRLSVSERTRGLRLRDDGDDA